MKSTLVLAALLISTSAFGNDVDPFGFEKEHFVSTASRADVVADLEVGQSSGYLPLGELGVKPVENESTRSRAQVAAETGEAARVGLLGGYGELGPKQATPEQEQRIELAGLRAIDQSAATE
jgi:hypothetical protein